MQEGVSKRLNEALDRIPNFPKGRGRTSAAAKLFEETHQSVRLWLVPNAKGDVGMPDVRKLPRISKLLSINLNWLLTGEGDMCPGGGEQVVEAKHIADALRFANEELSSQGFNLMSYDKQAQVLALMYETLAEGGELDNKFKQHLHRYIRIFG